MQQQISHSLWKVFGAEQNLKGFANCGLVVTTLAVIGVIQITAELGWRDAVDRQWWLDFSRDPKLAFAVHSSRFGLPIVIHLIVGCTLLLAAAGLRSMRSGSCVRGRCCKRAKIQPGSAVSLDDAQTGELVMYVMSPILSFCFAELEPRRLSVTRLWVLSGSLVVCTAGSWLFTRLFQCLMGESSFSESPFNHNLFDRGVLDQLGLITALVLVVSMNLLWKTSAPTIVMASLLIAMWAAFTGWSIGVQYYRSGLLGSTNRSVVALVQGRSVLVLACSVFALLWRAIKDKRQSWQDTTYRYVCGFDFPA